MVSLGTALVLPFALSVAACGGDGGSGGSMNPGTGGGGTGGGPVPAACTSGFATPNPSPAGPSPSPLPTALTLPSGFTGTVIAHVSSPRELAIAPSGDLFVATEGNQIYIVPHADDAGAAGAPQVFWTNPNGESPNAGLTLALADCTLYVGSTSGVWAVAYHPGEQAATSGQRIAAVRTGSVAPNSDGDVHVTTSVAYAQNALFVSVGSSCNACTETDPTRAVVLEFPPGGGSYTTKATRIRNAIALAVNPSSGHLWVAGAGQDDLPYGHPYEYADDLTAHSGKADYGWPDCEENHVAYVSGSNCSSTVEPIVELPAYSTIIGAAFYPANFSGSNAFPAQYQGGLFLATHGSWHTQPGSSNYASIPQVAFVAMNGDTPASGVNWSDPTTQWTTFFGGFQQGGTTRIGRPTGIVVGPTGSLFVADDQTGNIYRIRPIP